MCKDTVTVCERSVGCGPLLSAPASDIAIVRTVLQIVRVTALLWATRGPGRFSSADETFNVDDVSESVCARIGGLPVAVRRISSTVQL